MKRFVIFAALCALLLSALSLGSMAAVESYTVKSGDSLWSIAVAHGTSVEKLLELNSLSENATLSIGQQIKVEAGAAEQPPAETPVTQPEQPSTPVGADGYPGIAPPVGALFVQNGAYIPQEGREFTQAVSPVASVVSAAVIKLHPEKDELISINYQEVDLREIAARIGAVMGMQTLYFGEPVKVTVAASVVTPFRALEAALEAVGDYTYLVDGDLLMIGPQTLLKNTFPYSDVVTHRRMEAVDAEALRGVADRLGVEYASVEQEGDVVTLVATPRNLARLLVLADGLDYDESLTDGQLLLEPLELSFITSGQLLTLLEKFGCERGVVPDYTAQSRVYMSGTVSHLVDVREIAAAFDQPQNASIQRESDGLMAVPCQLTEAEPAAVEQSIEGCGIAFNILRLGDGRKTVYAVGARTEANLAADIAGELDGEDAVLTIVASASATKTLTTLRSAIVKETDLKSGFFTVTPNLGVSEPLYYLYCVTTAELTGQLAPYIEVS